MFQNIKHKLDTILYYVTDIFEGFKSVIEEVRGSPDATANVASDEIRSRIVCKNFAAG
jgi:hypothetical protein